MKTVYSRIAGVKLRIPVNGGYACQFVDHLWTGPDAVADYIGRLGGDFYTISKQFDGAVPPGTKVLVIRDMGFGDVLLATPLIRELSKSGAIVDVMTNSAYVCLFDGSPYVATVRPLELDDQKRQGWDIILDLRMVVENLEQAGVHEHRVDSFAAVADIKVADRHLDYFITDEERADGTQYMEPFRERFHTIVGYVWAPSHWNRTWPDGKHREVIAALSAAGYGLVVLSQNQMDLFSYGPNIINATGQGGIRRLGSILSACDAVLSPDTGTFHLAGALDIPTVGWFGPMDINERQAHRRVAVVNAAHRCARMPCRQYHCMHADLDRTVPLNQRLVPCLDVAPGAVVAAIEGVLDKSAESARSSWKRRMARQKKAA